MGYIRKSVHSIEEVENAVKPVMFIAKKKDSRIMFDGDRIKGNSQRYQLFFTKGTTCVCCGIQGKYFAKEKGSDKEVSYHLNLYATDKHGNEILMTKDHILPKSLGGKDRLTNYQTMCEPCNKQKGNLI